MKTRYYSMDFFKGIMCIAVVLIHANFLDTLGEVVRAVSRIAVPFFFFVSGFFLSDSSLTVNKKSLIKKLKHIAKLLVGAGIFYFIFTIIMCLIKNQALTSEFIGQYINPAKLLKFFVTNDPLKYSHLWYLLALIYCYLTFIIICYKGSITFNTERSKKIIILCIFVMTGGYLFFVRCCKYLNLRSTIQLFDTDEILVLANLYVFRSLAFLLLGILLRIYENNIKNWNIKKIKCICILGIIIGSVLSVIEYYLCGDALFYIGTYIALLSVSIMAVNDPDIGTHCKPLVTTGRNLSLYIYIYHMAVVDLVNWFFNSVLHIYTSTNPLYAYTRPFIVLVLTFLVAILLDLVTNKIKQKN